MDDLISRQAAISAVYESSVGRQMLWGHRDIIRTLKNLPSAQPDNQTNLCDSCDYSYPDCPSEKNDVIFGNDIGNDNICACNKYKPSAQPEIIRCKDCKYCEHWYADKGRCFLWAEDGIDVFDDGFCNYAERRRG